MKCLYCGEKLPWLQRLKNEKFCCAEHHVQFVKAQDTHAFSELMKRQSGAGARPAVPQHEPEMEPAEPEPEAAAASFGSEAAWSSESEEAAVEGAGENAGIRRQDLPETMEQFDPITEPESAREAGESLEERYARFLSLVESERHYYQELIEQLPAGVAVIGRNMKILYSNRAFRQLQSGEEEAASAGRISVTSEEVRVTIRSLLDGNGSGDRLVAVGNPDERVCLKRIPVLSEDGELESGVMVFAALDVVATAAVG